MRLAAADKPRRGPGFLLALILEIAQEVIEAYRSEHGLWDLFGDKVGTIAWTKIDGTDVYGENSQSPAYAAIDRAAAERMRDTLMQKYPEMRRSDNVGGMPYNAVFHAETTVLLRAARANGGTLAGRTLEVFVDGRTCNNCEKILPKVGLELGNPTVTFVDPKGSTRTIRNGSWEMRRGR